MLYIAFIIHFIADFLLQSREMGKNKSSNYKYLIQHISIIWVCFLPLGLRFATVNALIHAVIDKNIWNLYKISVIKRYPNADASFKYYDDHLFYSTIGLDQLLHTLTIVLLWRVL